MSHELACVEERARAAPAAGAEVPRRTARAPTFAADAGFAGFLTP